MRKIREVLRLKYELKLDNRQIGASCKISRVTVGKYLVRFVAAGLNWPLPAEVSDAQIMRQIFGSGEPSLVPARPMPDPATLCRELRRKGVTLQLLWQEYRETHPEGYGYSQFCEHFRRWEKRLHPRLLQEHLAGERMFVDYAGVTIPIWDPSDWCRYFSTVRRFNFNSRATFRTLRPSTRTLYRMTCTWSILSMLLSPRTPLGAGRNHASGWCTF